MVWYVPRKYMALNDLQDIKEEIRSRVDIVEVVSAYTRLKPAGKNFMGLCPFHADKKPSFSVTPSFQSYRCWSCGDKGDVFTFVQKKENLTFIEAMEVLAKRAGIPFERSRVSAERASEREEMHAINSVAVRFFQDRFTRSADALEYLTKRSILKETQARFDIGYAPPDWDALVGFLQRQRLSLEIAEKVGLIRRRREGDGYLDMYRNRLMFPIYDMMGNVAGFGGRSMGDEQPKYINSPQSDIFNKSRLLYGLFFARQTLGADTPPVFVEGYMDVVTAHQAGFTQCVATLGTAMTEEHARTLVRYNRKVILCYDGDSAGINATLKGAAVWDAMQVDGAELLVAALPAGEDPDSLLKRGDTAQFQKALDTAVPRVEFEIELILGRHNISRDDGRDAALREIIPVLASVAVRSTLDRYVQRIARLHSMYNFNVTRALESILADVQAYKQHQQRSAPSARQRGYDTIQAQNGAPLQETPPHQNHNAGEGFKRTFNPGTSNWQRATNKSGGQYWKKEKQGPPSDMTPPDLSLPALSAADKAERTLLRAMFLGTWRHTVASRLDASCFNDSLGADTMAWLLKAPTDNEGDIDPLELVNLLERNAEDAPAGTNNQPGAAAPGGSTEISATELDPFAQDAIELDPFEHESIPFPEDPPPDLIDTNEPYSGQYFATSGNHSAKLSAFIRELLEESDSMLSNEPLNEQTIDGCIRRLQERKTTRCIRDVKAELERTDLTLQQRKDLMDQLMFLMRAQRGSPPGGA